MSADCFTELIGRRSFIKRAAVSCAALGKLVWDAKAAAAVAAPAATVSAVTITNVTEMGATLTATVNPHGVATQAYFRYGPTASYGAVTNVQDMGSGTTPQQLHSAIVGLGPGTQYHVQAVAARQP